jgi:hypothetical protein
MESLAEPKGGGRRGSPRRRRGIVTVGSSTNHPTFSAPNKFVIVHPPL